MKDDDTGTRGCHLYTSGMLFVSACVCVCLCVCGRRVPGMMVMMVSLGDSLALGKQRCCSEESLFSEE